MNWKREGVKAKGQEYERFPSSFNYNRAHRDTDRCLKVKPLVGMFNI